MTNPNPSPLAEAQSDSLDELFSRDPLKLSDQDIEKIVVTLRAQREKWLSDEANGAKRATSKPKPSPPRASKATFTLDQLDDFLEKPAGG